jgi:nucleoside 2-deoxyribosyltransferase
MLIFFSAPLFCQAERAFNLQLTERLAESGFDVFLSQRDGVDSCKLPYNEMTNDVLFRAIFAVDQDRLLEADVLLCASEGRCA